MTTAHLVAHLGALGVRLDASAGRLRVHDPNGALGPELRAELVERKADVLALVAASRPAGAAEAPLVARRYDDDERPLSSGQVRLWFLEQLHPGSCAYHIPAWARLEGPLLVDALRASFEAVVERHEALRTTFEVRDGKPVGRARAARPFCLPVTDVAEADLRDRLLDEARRPFDLGAGPLLRARLFRTAPERHVLAMTAHHAASDGWSTAVVVRELAEGYAAYPERPDLDPLPVRFGDVASWQAEVHAREDAAAALAEAVEALTPPPPVLPLPTTRPRTSDPSFEGGVCERDLPLALADRVRETARAEGASPFMVLLSAYAVLLARTTGRAEFAVGTPVAAREHPALASLVGFFVNTLALPLRVAPGATFREVLHHVRDVSLDAFGRSAVPFDRVVEAVRPPRVAGVPPLVQTLFVHQTVPMPPLALDGVAPAPVRFGGGTAKYDLSLFVEDAGDGALRLVAEYATAWTDAADAERLLDSYEGVLAAALADPDGAVDRTPLRHAPPRAVPQAPTRTPTAPAADLERLVASVWSRLLGGQPVGPTDGFFDVGGHSLLAVQAQQQIATALGREVALLDLFAHPTPRALGARLAATAPADTPTPGAARAPSSPGGDGRDGDWAAVTARVARRQAARAARVARRDP